MQTSLALTLSENTRESIKKSFFALFEKEDITNELNKSRLKKASQETVIPVKTYYVSTCFL